MCLTCKDSSDNHLARHPDTGDCTYRAGLSKAKKAPPCPSLNYCIHPITQAKSFRTGDTCPPIEICDVCKVTATDEKLALHPDTNDCTYRPGMVKDRIEPPCPAVNYCTNPITGIKTFRSGTSCPQVGYAFFFI